jgi:HNH endonuclease
VGPLPAETVRRLACDAILTRVLVTRHPHHHPDHQHAGRGDGDRDGGPGGLTARLQTAIALLPAALGGAPTQPLEVGRATRVVTAAQRAALAVRDGGCVFPGCDRPLAWCDAHHLRHWLHGGPTDLANLALLCRAHHRAVHEGGWRLHRHAHGDLTVTPPHRRRPVAA